MIGTGHTIYGLHFRMLMGGCPTLSGVGSRKGGAFVLLYLSADPLGRLTCNAFNSQALISHLTNSNGCGNLQPKVLLTVSPSRPSFFPNPMCLRALHFLPNVCPPLCLGVSMPNPVFSSVLCALSPHSSLFTRHSPPPPLATSPLFSSASGLRVSV